MPRYIKIPKPADINGAKLSFHDWFGVLAMQPLWRETDATIAAYLEVDEAVEAKAPGDVAVVTDEAFDLGKRAIHEMRDINPTFLRVFMRMAKAWTSAATKRPEPEETAQANGAKAEVASA